MDKVKITRELADTIEYFRFNNLSNIDILLQKAENKFTLSTNSKNNKVLTSIDFDTLMNILINGYEVEETPEDKVREYYKEQRMTKGADQDSTDHAIKKVLDWLNIKIEGVNA